MNLNRIYHGVLKRAIKYSFPVWQKMGFHVSPNHFYHPVPDTRELPDSLWQHNSGMPGVDMKGEEQIALMATLSERYRPEYEKFPVESTGVPYENYLNNKSFVSMDAEVLHCLVRYLKPSRIIEVGSGFSTMITAAALEANKAEDAAYDCDFKAIDPYPSVVMQNGFPNFSGLIRKKVEEVPLNVFDTLAANDILFIDSSHVLKIGGDVQYEFLEIIPRVKPGVVVHIHDIFLPAEYPRDWVMKEHRFWNEQYLLQAFLAFNTSFEVLWSSSYMDVCHPAESEAAFPAYSRQRNQPPASFWMRRIS